MKDTIVLEKYSEVLSLQESLNASLREGFEANKHQGRDFLASFVVDYVETLIERLNSQGSTFGRVDYDGDVNFENSEQTYSDGDAMGYGVVLHFVGFSVQARWEGRDRYA